MSVSGWWWTTGGSISVYVMVSPSFLFGDLFAPRASLRPPALVMLTHDMVKVHGTGDVVCKQRLPGL